MSAQEAFCRFTYGLYVIGAKSSYGFAGCVIDAVMQTTCSPARFVMSCLKNNATPLALSENPDFTLSVLPKDVDPFIIANFGFQSSRNVAKWENVSYTLVDGLPVLTENVAYLRAKVTEIRDLGTHLLLFCDALDGQANANKQALTYTYYQEHLKQLTNEAFKKEQSRKTGEKTMTEEKNNNEKKEKWVCSVCGYVYDGDVPFEELPDDYLCPICGEPKSAFVKE